MVKFINHHIIFMVVFSFAFHSQAQDNHITFATMEQMPYGYLTEEKNKTGLLYEMMELIRQRIDINAEHRLFPVKRLVNYLHSNQPTCSLIVNTYDYIDTFNLVAPIDIYLNAGIVVKNRCKAVTINNLSSLTIAVPLGLKISPEFDFNDSLNKLFPPRYSNALEMFKFDTVDAVAGAIPTILYIAKQKGIPLTQIAKPIVMSSGKLYLVCNKGVSKELQNKLAESVNQLKQLNAFKDITEKYFDDSAKHLWALRH